MTTHEASPFSIRDSEAPPTCGTPLRIATRRVDTTTAHPSGLDQPNSEQRVKAVDAAAICMESGCFGG